MAPPEGQDQSAPEPNDIAPRTLFFKTFSFQQGDGKKVRPIETRVIRLGEDGWEYHRYLWNDSADDASLLTSSESELVSVRVEDEEFEHDVPSDLDCERCHEASDNPVPGYREIQLSDEPLESAPDATTERVMGYVLGNCTHCHNGLGTDANNSLDSLGRFWIGDVGASGDNSIEEVNVVSSPGQTQMPNQPTAVWHGLASSTPRAPSIATTAY